MSEHLSKDEFIAHIDPIKEDIRELLDYSREQNNRLSKVEGKVGVLSWAYAAGAAAISFITYKITGTSPQ